MRRYAFLIIVGLALVAMAGAVIVRALSSGGEQSGGGWRGGATPVAVHDVALYPFADVVEALGTARANESVTITAKVSDVIARLEFDSGDAVEAGQILVELADAEEAAGLSEARATLRETARDVERIRDLTERGVAPRSRLDEAVAANERARARVTGIEARVADRIIRAPFSGVVGLRNVSVGELVRPGDVIAQLDDASVIKLDFTVPERFLSVIEPGLNVQAVSAAFPDEVFDGVVGSGRHPHRSSHPRRDRARRHRQCRRPPAAGHVDDRGDAPRRAGQSVGARLGHRPLPGRHLCLRAG
jgi:membrane fusion protein (multidrug efflux system)